MRKRLRRRLNMILQRNLNKSQFLLQLQLSQQRKGYTQSLLSQSNNLRGMASMLAAGFGVDMYLLRMQRKQRLQFPRRWDWQFQDRKMCTISFRQSQHMSQEDTSHTQKRQCWH